MKPLKLLVSFVALILIYTGCSHKVEPKRSISQANFQQINWEELDGFETDDISKALKVFIKDCRVSQKDKRLKEVCTKATLQENLEDPKAFFLDNFTPYQLISDEGDDEGLITGYYEPLLYGSYTQTKRFKYPLYAVPENLITVDLKGAYTSLKNYTLRGKIQGKKLVPYETREEINEIDHTTNNNLKAICFVDDKIDLFFLQIQGSGKVQLESGEYINIGYGGQNGHPYYSIGKKLLEEDVISKKDMSLQSIKQWLLKNPNRIDEILNLNRSYIFFRQSVQTATGSLGTQLTANRNIAVDRKNIPLGFPVFINTTNPITQEPIKKLMVAADTGGAIKGKIRADLFFGNGEEARKLAGNMKQSGELFILLPKENNISIDEKKE